MARLVVAGGGLAGLGFAVFAARRGHSVTVVERDAPPSTETIDDAIAWRRPGAPQGHQTHAMLASGRRILLDEAPDIVDALLSRGVRELPADVGRGSLSGECALLGRRPLVEAIIRDGVRREPRVTVLSPQAVVGLDTVATDGGDVVRGVHLTSGEVLSADLVVDAGGRRSALPSWLSALDLRPPVDTVQQCGFFYLTRFYRIRSGHHPPPSTIPAAVSLDYATVMSIGADSDVFSVTLTLSNDDPLRSAVRDPERHEAVLRAFPSSAPWLDAGEPISGISMMAGIENRRRTLVDAEGPIVGGIVVLGDAALHTNPTLGRGISLGFAHARHLADVADEAIGDPIGFVDRFEAWTEEHLGVWFHTQVASDAATIRRLEAGLRGERLPMPTDPASRFAAGVFGCAREDEVVGRAAARVVHLFEPPSTAFADPDVAGRVMQWLAANPDVERPQDVPSRSAFEQLARG